MGLRSETQQQGNQNVYQGGPGEGVEGQPIEGDQQQQQQQASEGQQQQPKAAFTPVYVGGRLFNSVEELANYTSQLESRQTQQATNPALENANKPKVSDLLLQDTEAFVNVLKEDAKNEVLNIIEQREAQRNIWNNFYGGTHKDLSEHKDLVEFFWNKRKIDFKDLPAVQALDKVGNEVRSYLGRIRGSNQGGKELSGAPAVVAGSSNGVAPAQPPAKTEPTSFISQVRQYQKRGR